MDVAYNSQTFVTQRLSAKNKLAWREGDCWMVPYGASSRRLRGYTKKSRAHVESTQITLRRRRLSHCPRRRCYHVAMTTRISRQWGDYDLAALSGRGRPTVLVLSTVSRKRSEPRNALRRRSGWPYGMFDAVHDVYKNNTLCPWHTYQKSAPKTRRPTRKLVP